MQIFEDIPIAYAFEIPPDQKLRSGHEVEKLIDRIIAFHQDYIVISRQYRIAEVFTEEYLVYKGFTIDNYLRDMATDLRLNAIRFFPHYGIHTEAMFASDFYYYDKNKAVVNNYIYGMYAVKRSGIQFCTLDDLKAQKIEVTNGIELDTSGYLGYCAADYFTEPVGFKIRVLADLFFPFLPGANDEKIIDNKELALLNVPRFNAFLRDLKNLFINKYGWKFTFEYDKYVLESFVFFTEDGITINGELMFEDCISNKDVTGL